MNQDGSSSTKGLFNELNKQLQKGWFGANLQRMSRFAREAAWVSPSPSSLLLLSELLWILHHQWSDDGDQSFVPGHAAKLMEEDIGPAFAAYFDAASERSLSVEDERGYLDDIVLAIFRWRSRDDLDIERPPWSPRGI
jgi:hypothetical protein